MPKQSLKKHPLIWKWKLSKEHLPQTRADLAILSAIESEFQITRSRLQKIIKEGGLSINGIVTHKAPSLKPGDEVVLTIPVAKPLELKPQDLPIEILYEDSHLVVINKPQGLTVHPSATQTENTLVNALLFQIKDLSGIGGYLRPGIVHRIDKDTSGALVITKTDLAHQALSELFSKHDIDRKYLALCFGAPETKGPLTIETQIGRNPSDRKKMAIVKSGGRRAITIIETLETYGMGGNAPFASLIQATLKTGRTHQLRVHLTSLSHSILGDPVYGSPGPRQAKWTQLPEEVQAWVKQLPGQALHAQTLGFQHPVTQEKLHFKAPPPEIFQNLLKTLRKFKVSG